MVAFYRSGLRTPNSTYKIGAKQQIVAFTLGKTNSVIRTKETLV